MCIGTAENLVRRGPARKVRRPSLEELLTSAAEAARAAPNRAAKRRVRQRLHKKLGAMLTIEEFEQAMDRFQAMVEDTQEEPNAKQPLPRAGVSSVPVLLLPVATPMQVLRPQPPQPAPVNKQAFSQAPTPQRFLGGFRNSVPPQRLLDHRLLQPHPPRPSCERFVESELALDCCRVLPGYDANTWQEQGVYCLQEARPEPTALEEESDSDLSTDVQWMRAMSDEVSQLPVERTFIQFNTCGRIHRRRSRSV
ncbi:unnamed protein product, partial [Symbiodinium sp. CCMP2456]